MKAALFTGSTDTQQLNVASLDPGQSHSSQTAVQALPSTGETHVEHSSETTAALEPSSEVQTGSTSDAKSFEAYIMNTPMESNCAQQSSREQQLEHSEGNSQQQEANQSEGTEKASDTAGRAMEVDTRNDAADAQLMDMNFRSPDSEGTGRSTSATETASELGTEPSASETSSLMVSASFLPGTEQRFVVLVCFSRNKRRRKR